MEIPTMLTMELVAEAASCLGWSAARDLAVMQDRCKHEGMSFLTITLPLLSDALERGLEDGRLTCPTNFSRHGALPRLLGGLFKRVFSPDGVVLPNPCVESIYAIRQICRFQKKLRISCTPSRERSAISRYKAVEEELFHVSASIKTRQDEILDSVSSVLWSQVFPEIDPEELICRHGPGATSEKWSTNRRLTISYWYNRFEHTYPLSLHAYHNYGAWSEVVGSVLESAKITEIGVLDEPPVRVVFVPKTLKSPRVIAIEPSTMQFVQQSLMSYMVGKLEGNSLTKNSVRFTDQSVNQSLAQVSSKTRHLATLDMSDASDRVSLALVQRIFARSSILPYLEDARSLHATLPDGTDVVLSKYASMGSALCFPVEASVFYTLIQASMHWQDRVRPTARSIKKYSSLIDVYGDDIIVPVNYTDSVVSYLESFALKVNSSKSFRNSLFRESCGGDFYDGIPVKPVYLRELLPSTLTTWTPTQVMSACSTANQLYEAGWWRTCQALREVVQRVVKRPIPRSRFTGTGVFFTSFMFTTNCSYNRTLQVWQQKRLVYCPVSKRDSITTAAGYFNKAFSLPRRQSSSDRPLVMTDFDCEISYDSSVKRGVFKPKRQWITVR